MTSRRDLLPIALVVVALVGTGVWANQVGLADPASVGPRTLFTPGQYLAAAVSTAQIAELGHWSTTTDLLGWPQHPDLRVVMWPTQLLALLVGPLPAVNLAFALIPALNAVAGWALGRTLRLGAWASAALGGVIGWSPWVREVLANGQLEQAVVGCVALQWAVALRAVEAERRFAGHLVGVAAVTWAAAMTGPHVCIAGCLGLAAWALLAGRPARWAAVLVAAALGALSANAYQAGNFSSALQVFSPKGSDDHPGGLGGLAESATLPSLLRPPTERLMDIGAIHPTYLGLALLVAAGVALATRAQGRRAGSAGLALLVLVAFALGPDVPLGRLHVPGPFALLGMVSPAIARSGSAYRMVGGATVALGVLAAFAVRGPRSAVALVLAAWAETQLVATRPLAFLPMQFTPDHVLEPLRAGEGAILDLPLVAGTCPGAEYHYAFEATRRLRPTPVLPSAPGIYPTLPGLHGRLAAAARGDGCGARLEALVRELGVGGVVLHTHDPTCKAPASLERCLLEAFGPGQAVEGLRWWDPLPAP